MEEMRKNKVNDKKGGKQRERMEERERERKMRNEEKGREKEIKVHFTRLLVKINFNHNTTVTSKYVNKTLIKWPLTVSQTTIILSQLQYQ